MKKKKKPNGYWTETRLMEEALLFKTIEEFYTLSPSAYAVAIRKGHLRKIGSHLIGLRKEWDFDTNKINAMNYKNRGEFYHKDPTAYAASLRSGRHEEICSHMTPSITEEYSFDELKEEALKYKYKRDFKINSPNQYMGAYDRADYEEICSHMERPKISIPEEKILEEVKKKFPTAKKFRATKLNIPGKEHIKTLEVDIFVPELGKAIEYDSERFHSFDGLKRGHPTWPEEDIRNYHEIKDEIFLSLGIEVLHIRQKEWRKDSRKCIEKCLKFLEINK